MLRNQPSVVACVTSQYESDRIIETAEQLAAEYDCELHVLSVLMPTENYALISGQLEYLNRVSKSAGADMHDGGYESFLVQFNKLVPDISITMVDKNRNVYTMDVRSRRTV